LGAIKLNAISGLFAARKAESLHPGEVRLLLAQWLPLVQVLSVGSSAIIGKLDSLTEKVVD
jgi:hypothetical protein